MDKQEIIQFLNTNPVVYLATAEDNQPHVRGMMLYRADDKGIIFHTGTGKDLSQQMLKNPKVELCCFNPQSKLQVRVSGVAELINDLELKKEIVNNRQFLKPWVDQYGYESLAVYRIKDCKATPWTFETNLAPKEYIKL
jgi:pyridoxamine 5'-phosphate oxidase